MVRPVGFEPTTFCLDGIWRGHIATCVEFARLSPTAYPALPLSTRRCPRVGEPRACSLGRADSSSLVYPNDCERQGTSRLSLIPNDEYQTHLNKNHRYGPCASSSPARHLWVRLHQVANQGHLVEQKARQQKELAHAFLPPDREIVRSCWVAQ